MIVMKQTINKIEHLEKYYSITFNEDDKKYLTYYFKTKVLQVENKKIVYPKLTEIKKKQNELNDNLSELKKEELYWKKTKNNAENYYKNIAVNMVFKKKYWQHKIKKLIDKDYKKDVIDSKLTDQILMDPEYQHLFNTFLIDPDYRHKLKETVNNSIVYKDTNIGEYSKKKQDFKKDTAKSKIEQIAKKVKEIEFNIKVYNKISEIIKKYS